MVGWIGKLLLIQVSSIAGTIGVVAIVSWSLPLGVVGTVTIGVLISGLLFIAAAYRLVDWDTVSAGHEWELDS